jgi:leucine dehydrogenase
MEDLIREWDGEYVLTRYDRLSGTWMFIAVHSTVEGVAAGGTRLKSYASPREGLRDALRLAEGMTYKFVLAGQSFGGGKAVLAVPGDLDPGVREGLLSRYGGWLADLKGVFMTAADIGTGPADMAVIARYYDGVVGLPAAQGGSGDQGPPTARGVFYGIQAACEHHFGSADLSDRTALVQGVGSVGGALVDLLLEAGCRVKFSDVHPALIGRFRDERGLTFVEPEAVYREPCDVFAPCATGAILNSRTIPQLAAKIVAGSANNQLEEPGDGEALHRRGILYAPDYIVNAGAVIFVAAVDIDGQTGADANEHLRMIGDTLCEVLAKAQTAGISPARMADQLAKERRQTREQSG